MKDLERLIIATANDFGLDVVFDPEPCPACGHFACICAIEREHKPDCRYLKAATCTVAIECAHGRDVCPVCDPCTCIEGG